MGIPNLWFKNYFIAESNVSPFTKYLVSIFHNPFALVYFIVLNFLRLSRLKFLIDSKRRSRGSRLAAELGILAFKSRLMGLSIALRNGGGTGGIGMKELSPFVCLFTDKLVFWILIKWSPLL